MAPPFELMSPSVHSFHQQELFRRGLGQVLEKKLGAKHFSKPDRDQLEKVVLRPQQPMKRQHTRYFGVGCMCIVFLHAHTSLVTSKRSLSGRLFFSGADSSQHQDSQDQLKLSHCDSLS
jgi:hypothetical protein